MHCVGAVAAIKKGNTRKTLEWVIYKESGWSWIRTYRKKRQYKIHERDDFYFGLKMEKKEADTCWITSLPVSHT